MLFGTTPPTQQEYEMKPVTQLAHYRAVRQKPVTDWFRWHETLQMTVLAVVNYQFAAHRDFIRLFLR